MERFRLGGAVVGRACEGMTAEELDRSPGPGRWTARQVLCHLMDSEMVGRDRLARTLAEENPRLEWYDQDLWAARLDYHQRGFEQALALFQAVRQANYELLRGVREADWERRAIHSKTGALTLWDLLVIYTEHAEQHARQIRAARGE
jgi:uncharacterized damage-inducible protein DinB